MHWYVLDEQVWHDRDEHEPDPESKIWRLTGFGAEFARLRIRIWSQFF